MDMGGKETAKEWFNCKIRNQRVGNCKLNGNISLGDGKCSLQEETGLQIGLSSAAIKCSKGC